MKLGELRKRVEIYFSKKGFFSRPSVKIKQLKSYLGQETVKNRSDDEEISFFNDFFPYVKKKLSSKEIAKNFSDKEIYKCTIGARLICDFREQSARSDASISSEEIYSYEKLMRDVEAYDKSRSSIRIARDYSLILLLKLWLQTIHREQEIAFSQYERSLSERRKKELSKFLDENTGRAGFLLRKFKDKTVGLGQEMSVISSPWPKLDNSKQKDIFDGAGFNLYRLSNIIGRLEADLDLFKKAFYYNKVVTCGCKDIFTFLNERIGNVLSRIQQIKEILDKEHGALNRFLLFKRVYELSNFVNKLDTFSYGSFCSKGKHRSLQRYLCLSFLYRIIELNSLKDAFYFKLIGDKDRNINEIGRDLNRFKQSLDDGEVKKDGTENVKDQKNSLNVGIVDPKEKELSYLLEDLKYAGGQVEERFTSDCSACKNKKIELSSRNSQLSTHVDKAKGLISGYGLPGATREGSFGVEEKLTIKFSEIFYRISAALEVAKNFSIKNAKDFCSTRSNRTVQRSRYFYFLYRIIQLQNFMSKFFLMDILSKHDSFNRMKSELKNISQISDNLQLKVRNLHRELKQSKTERQHLFSERSGLQRLLTKEREKNERLIKDQQTSLERQESKLNGVVKQLKQDVQEKEGKIRYLRGVLTQRDEVIKKQKAVIMASIARGHFRSEQPLMKSSHRIKGRTENTMRKLKKG